MLRDAKYLVFGLLVLAGYWLTVQRGIVYMSGDRPPAPPGARSGAPGRASPSFWSTGFQGGK